ERMLNHTETMRTRNVTPTHRTKPTVVSAPSQKRITYTTEPSAAHVAYNCPRLKMLGVCAKKTSRITPPNEPVITPNTGATINDVVLDWRANAVPKYAHRPSPNPSTIITQLGMWSLRMTLRTGFTSGSIIGAFLVPWIPTNVPTVATIITVMR